MSDENSSDENSGKKPSRAKKITFGKNLIVTPVEHTTKVTTKLCTGFLRLLQSNYKSARS